MDLITRNARCGSVDFFKGVRLYIKDKDTGLLAIKFVCQNCGKEMDEPEQYQIPCSYNTPLIQKAKFYCNECYNGGNNNGKAG